jgi:hypothetical protein
MTSRQDSQTQSEKTQVPGYLRLLRMVRRVVIVLLTLYGGGNLAFHGLRLWYQSGLPGDVTIGLSSGQRALISPDGAHKAVPFTQIGGGGLAPYCNERVSIVHADVPDRQAWRISEVYLAGCNALKGLSWLSDSTLQIALDPNTGTSGVESLRLRAYADRGKVRLLYVFQTAQAEQKLGRQGPPTGDKR